ncbi:tape measure protein [Parapusillimonas sp. JC17]|uniref:tape measure protein n=1 Tax=Parapusillimonas sp. JC17 TaxID=3445768 RepID=UPI003F9F328D
MEVAALGLKIDGVEGVDRARDALGRFTKASEDAERSAAGVGKGSDAAARAMRGMDNAARRSSASMANLAQVAARAGVLLGTALSVRALQTYADSWSDMQSKVGAAVKNMQAAPALMRRIVDIANASYSPLQQTVDIYTRNVAVLRELGKSSAEAADFTESLNHMLVITATKGQQAESVQQALSKAMAVGKLQADGLETVLANGGRVAEALAKALGTNVNGLRDMASQGKITSQVIAGTLIGSLIEVRTEAEKMPATMGDAFGRAQNNLSELVGRLDQAAGASSAIAEKIIGLADGIRKTGDRLIAFGQYAAPVFDAVGSAVSAVASQADIAVVALAGFYAPAMLGGIALLTKSLAVGLVGAIRAVTAAMMANPIGLMVAALTAAGYAAYKFRDDIQRSLGVDVVGAVKGVANFVIGAFAYSFENVKFIWNNLGDIVGAAMVGAANVAIRALNKITSAATGSIDGLITLVNKIPGIEKISSLGDVLKINEMENPFAGRLAEAGKQWQEGFVSSIKTDYVDGALDWLRDKIAEAFDPKPIEDFVDAAGGGGGGGGGGVSKELKKWLDDMRIATASARTMTEAYLTGGDAISQLTRQVEIESKVLEHGAKTRNAVTDAITAQAIALDRLDIAKQIDGLREQNTQASAYLKVLTAQSKGYKEGATALTAYNKQQALTELLVGKTADEVRDLTEHFSRLWDESNGLARQTAGMEELNRLVEGTRTKQEAYNHELEKLLALRPYAQTEEQVRALELAIGDLNRENSVWFTFTEDAINRIDESFANMWRDWMDGSRSAFDAMKSGFKQMLAEMAHAAITRPIMISVGNAVMGTRTPGGIGDVWGAARGANNLNSIFGAGYQALTGASAGASTASLGYANLVGAMGGDSIGALISANGGWEGALSGLSSAAGTAFASGITAVAPSVMASLGSGAAGALASGMATTSFSASLAGGAAGAAGGAAAGAGGLMTGLSAAAPYIGIGLAAASAFGLFDSGPPKTRHGQRTTIDYTGGAFGVSALDDRQAAGSEQAALAAAQSAVAAANDLFAKVGVNAGIESFYAIMESSVLGDRNGVASGGSLRIGDQLRQIGVAQASDMTFGGFGGWSSAEMLPRLQTDIQLSILEAFQALGSQLPSVLSGMLEGVDMRNIDAATAQDLATRFAAVADGATQFLTAIEALPFEQLRGLSFDAAAGLVQLAGGVENLLGAQQTYFQAYYSEAERHGIAVNNLTSALAAAGVVIPELTGSTEQMLASYRTIVEAQDLNTEAGRQAYVVLMQASGAFAEVAQYAGQVAQAVEEVAVPARSLADIERERAGLESQLLGLLGNTNALRRRELETLDASNRALQQQIWAFQDLSTAYNDVVAAGEREIARLKESFGATDTAMSAYRSAVQRLESEFGSLIATIGRGVADLRSQVTEAARMQYDQARAVISTALITRQLPQTADLTETLRIAQQGVTGQVYGSLFEQQKAYLILANEMEALQGIAQPELDTARATLTQLENQYRLLRGMGLVGEDSLTALEQQLRTAISTEEAARRQISAIEEQINWAKEQYNVLLEIRDGVLTFPEALASFAQTLAAAVAAANKAAAPVSGGGGSAGGYTPVPGAGIGSSSWTTDYFRANPDVLQGYDVAHGMSPEAWAQYHWNTYGQYEGRKFAAGGFALPGWAMVGEEGPELVNFSQPGRVYTAGQTDDILRSLGAGNGSGNAGVITELRALREQNARLERRLASIERSTGQFASQFDNVTAGGNAMLTEDAATL